MDYFEAIEMIKKEFDYNFLGEVMPCPDIHNPWVGIYYNCPTKETEPNYYNTLGQYRKVLWSHKFPLFLYI